MILALEPISRAYEFNLTYAKELVSDVSDELLYRSFGDGTTNHPGFTLGHLSVASALIAEHLGQPYSLSNEWDEWFRRRGPGDPRRPSQFVKQMPSKAELIEELSLQHRKVSFSFDQLDQKDLTQEAEWRFSGYFPSLTDYLTFMCITHEAMHLGQVAAWRRAAGLESSLARL